MAVKYQSYYFPGGLRWSLLSIFVIWSVYLAFWTKAYIWVLLFAVISIILFSTKYVTEINLEKKEIIDMFSFIGLGFPELYKFQNLNHISIDKKRHTYNANSRSRTRTADFFEYSGILNFDDEKSFIIISSVDYKELKEAMNNLAKQLNLEVIKNF